MKWRLDGSGSALASVVGRRRGTEIDVAAWRGNTLGGPYLAMPAGRLYARVLLAPGPPTGRSAWNRPRATPPAVGVDLGYTTLSDRHHEAAFFFDGRPPEPVDLMLEVARIERHVATADVRLEPDRHRHRFALPFANDRSGG